MVRDTLQIVYDVFYFFASFWNVYLEYIFLLLILSLFIWRTWKVAHDPELWPEIRRWVSASIGAAFIVMLCLYISEGMWPGDDYALWRYIVIRVVAICIGVVGITGALIFFDVVTDGDWFGAIEKTEYGPSIVLSAMILALALIIIST